LPHSCSAKAVRIVIGVLAARSQSAWPPDEVIGLHGGPR